MIIPNKPLICIKLDHTIDLGGEIMGGFGGFYKGEKKKKKIKDTKLSSSGAPVLVMPEIISKKKKEE